MSYEREYMSCSELQAAAQRVMDGAHDALLFDMTSALERVYRDADAPMATILLPASRNRCAVVAGHG
jgi:hypothetical protein